MSTITTPNFMKIGDGHVRFFFKLVDLAWNDPNVVSNIGSNQDSNIDSNLNSNVDSNLDSNVDSNVDSNLDSR